MSTPSVTEQLPEPVQTSIADLLAIVQTVWDTSFLGLSVGAGLAALGIIVIAFVFRGLFSAVIVHRVRKAAESTQSELDDKLLDALYGPIKMIPVIIGVYISVNILGLRGENAAISGDSIVQTLVIIALFWGLRNAVDPVAHLFKPLRRALNPVMIDWLAKALKILFIIIGAAAVLSAWGIPVAPVIGGLGLLGVAVGLGAQDLFKNLISGILIITEKRFVPGEWIKVDGVVEGTVEKINFRSTLIRRFDKSPVYVPNSALSDAAVTNFSRMTYRRIKWAIGVEYRTTVDQLKYIRDEIEAWLWHDDRFVKPPEAALFVRVDNFNASSIDFLIYTFTRTKDWGEWLAIKEEFAVAVMDIIEKAGTGFAFPSRTIYMQQTDPPEIMAPPAPSEGVEHAQTMIADSGKRRGMGEADDDG